MIGLAAGLGGCQAPTERGTMSVSPVKLGGGGAEYVAAVSAAAVLRVRPGIEQSPGYESRRPAASSSMADRSIASAEITPSRQRVCARNVA